VSSYFPHSAESIVIGPAFPLTAAQAAPPPFSTSPPVSTILVAVPNLKLPRTYEWNAALEQSLGASQSLSLTYVGAVGRDLLRVTNLVPGASNPKFSFLNVTDNSATSNYNALADQVRPPLVAWIAGAGVVYVFPFDRYCLDRCSLQLISARRPQSQIRI
jgi:hypothetical protein